MASPKMPRRSSFRSLRGGAEAQDADEPSARIALGLGFRGLGFRV